MRQHRRTELMDAASKLKAEHEKKFPDKVLEPPVPREPMPSVLGQSMSSRQEAKRREAREYAGLDPTYMHINPHRELQSGTTLDYIEEPANKTRSEMQEKRKREMREEVQKTRRAGELDYVPAGTRHTWREAESYEERR